MSVVYGKRGLSQMEFWKMINKIEKEIIFLLLHDFGVKTRTRSPQFYASVEHMNEADVEQFKSICDKYHMQSIEDEYPAWLIEYLRDTTIRTIAKIKRNIRDANEVYPFYETVRGLKFYGAYMDDRYAILQTKKEALEVLQEFRQRADALKLTINEKKTQIVRLEKGFTFLKMRYVLTETGKIVEYQSADTFTRERRRIKAFKRIGMEPERAAECYRSWRGTVLRIPNNYFRVKRMDQLFAELFPGADFRTQKEKRKEHDENLQHSRQGTEEAGRVAERERTSTPW